MKRRDFIKLVSAAGTTSLGSGCFSDADRPNVLSSKGEVLSPADLRCEYLENPVYLFQIWPILDTLTVPLYVY
jgi:hypothetical protein